MLDCVLLVLKRADMTATVSPALPPPAPADAYLRSGENGVRRLPPLVLRGSPYHEHNQPVRKDTVEGWVASRWKFGPLQVMASTSATSAGV